jgi:regulator of sirC expression with transglutaminase-like and TPR domain
MNIFSLDNDTVPCAQHHCEQHVGKMILDSANLLFTALNPKPVTTAFRRCYFTAKSAFSTESKRQASVWFVSRKITQMTAS